MLHDCADALTNFLYRRCALPLERRAVYRYGFELTLSTTASMVSIVIVSFLLGSPLSSLLFLLFFITLRLFAGGYHAETYRSCFLTTNGTFLAVFLLSSGLARFRQPALFLALLLLSGAVVWALAPIRNKHHPLSEKTYQKNKKVARGLTLAAAVLISAVFWSSSSLLFLSVSVTSVMAVAILMIIPKLNEGRKEHD